jgi:hypothetical protein
VAEIASASCRTIPVRVLRERSNRVVATVTGPPEAASKVLKIDPKNASAHGGLGQALAGKF